jgi:hypothetical protein
VVCRVDDGILEAARVLEVQVQLARFRMVGLQGAGTNVRLELVEAVGNNLWIVVNKYYCWDRDNGILGTAERIGKGLSKLLRRVTRAEGAQGVMRK